MQKSETFLAQCFQRKKTLLFWLKGVRRIKPGHYDTHQRWQSKSKIIADEPRSLETSAQGSKLNPGLCGSPLFRYTPRLSKSQKHARTYKCAQVRSITRNEAPLFALQAVNIVSNISYGHNKQHHKSLTGSLIAGANKKHKAEVQACNISQLFIQTPTLSITTHHQSRRKAEHYWANSCFQPQWNQHPHRCHHKRRLLPLFAWTNLNSQNQKKSTQVAACR